MRITILLFLAVTLFSCKRQVTSSTKLAKEQSVWVNSHRPDAESFLLQFSDELGTDWDTLSCLIKEFDYRPGSLYHLKVRKEKSPESPNTYQMVEMIEQRIDPILQIHDIWALRDMPGFKSESTRPSRAYIEINTSNMQLMGQAHCNSISTSIEVIDEKNLVFGPIVQTKKACPNLADETEFTKRLNQVATYKREGLALTLLDKSGGTLLTFKKMD